MMESPPTRDKALRFLAHSIIFGNLGLFVGAGLSRAVLERQPGRKPLSWEELVRAAAEKLSIDFEDAIRPGNSFPEIATNLCKLSAERTGQEYAEVRAKLKEIIADLSSWYPDEARRTRYSSLLEQINPCWVITTNYDLVIESLLTGRCLSLGPDDQLIRPKELVPVYHLHGIRTNPASIVITQEDYVALFRPQEYRQIKLALTIKESVTLILGYDLGDVNVLTAVDWCRNVFPNTAQKHPHDIVQVFRKENPSASPYRDNNNVLVIETNEIRFFLEELVEVFVSEHGKHVKSVSNLKEISEMLANPTVKDVDDFIENDNKRKLLLTNLTRSGVLLISGFMIFFQKCQDAIWERAKPNKAFRAYDEGLTIILDILVAFDVKNMPPALFQSTAYWLNRLAYYIGDRQGDSWEAFKTWKQRRGEIAAETIRELTSIANQSGFHDLIRLLSI